ncbi:MAG: zinc ribbon domain-containing protein, partial [Comamonas sp.]
MLKQVEFKSIDFGQLLRATEGLTQLRSMGLMFLTLLVSGLLFGLGVRLGMVGILVLGLVSAVVSVAGTAAVGIMLLDKAKNQEPRPLKDAFIAGLSCVPKIILYLLLLVALFVALSVVAAILYYICKIPFIGPVLLFFVHPALVLLAASIFIVLFWLVAPILMPALWDGRSLKAGIGLVLAVARERLIQVVVMVLILYMLLGVVYLVVTSGFVPGFMMMSGLAGGITGGGGMMMGSMGGGFGGMGSSMGGASGGAVIALAASSLVIISVVMALLMQVMFMGYNLIYLMATEGLDEHATEESLQAGIALAREKARQAQEKAREAAEKVRNAVPASASANANSGPVADAFKDDIFASQPAPA